MSFSVSFNLAVPSGYLTLDSASLEPGGEYETLVMEACSALSDVGVGRFHIGGFGFTVIRGLIGFQTRRARALHRVS